MPRRKPLNPKSPLRPLPKDKRDFRLGASFTLPKLSEIPLTDWSFDVPLEIKNQLDQASPGYDDMCAPNALASVLEDHEAVPLDPGYGMAKSKQLEGDPMTWGSDLRTIAKTAVKFGALPKSKSPFLDKKRLFVADPANWPALYDDYAAAHKQQSYFNIEGPYDYFDNLRAALWYFRNQKNSVLAGSFWYPGWLDKTIIDSIPASQPSGHAFKCRITQRIINGKPYLAIQNSYGAGIGENGTQFFSREVVNREWKPFGAFMFVDIDPELVKQQKITIAQKIVELLQRAIYLLTPKPEATSTPSPEPVPIPVPTPIPAPKPESLQDMARRAGREEGLTVKQIRELMATIHAESHWNPKAVHHNSDKRRTTDYGLCQLNSYWYIGPTKEVKTPAEALANPELCVRVMAKAWRNGRAIDWYGYRDKKYLAHIHLY